MTEINYNSIAFNSLLKKSICSYRWPLNVDDFLYEFWKEDLQECTKDWLVEIEWIWKVNEDDIETDWYFIDRDKYCQDVAETLWRNIDIECWYDNEWRDITDIFRLYWVDFKWVSLWQPLYYNFNQDELSWKYEFDDEPIDESLNSYIENYIENVRTKSYDWYMSFEPSSLEKVTKLDYAFIYAILDKHWLVDSCKQWIDNGIEEILTETIYQYICPIYRYNWNEYRIDWDKHILVLKD